MKFAKLVFRLAGVWGLLVIAPLYFAFDYIGQKDPPAITHPGFFYGFIGVALAWQVAFLIIASDPVRYRPLILPCLIEKTSYVITVVVLVSQARMRQGELAFAGIDSLLAVLFAMAYFKTPSRNA